MDVRVPQGEEAVSGMVFSIFAKIRLHGVLIMVGPTDRFSTRV